MAHVLVADEWPRDKLFRFLLEEEGHTVTVVTNGWDMLMTMRATLHPLIVVYDERMLAGPWNRADESQNVEEEVWQACARHMDDLRRHRFIELGIARDPMHPQIHSLREQLGAVRMWMPLDLNELLTRINEAVAQLEPAP